MPAVYYNKSGAPYAFCNDGAHVHRISDGKGIGFIEKDRVFDPTGAQVGWCVGETILDPYGRVSLFTRSASFNGKPTLQPVGTLPTAVSPVGSPLLRLEAKLVSGLVNPVF
jgi:hypothetical protein